MEAVRQLRPQTDEQTYRLAPQNIEAEQALLGAILVNNEAFYRVSDFLGPEHFYEPVHRDIYEVLGQIIRAGRTATPVTAKTHLPDELMENVTMAQYLARLAAEATTVLNAYDYGQSIYDLSLQRALIQIGEEMVDTAYRPGVETPPGKQIEAAERQLFELAEQGRYDGGFQGFNKALLDAIKVIMVLPFNGAEAIKRLDISDDYRGDFEYVADWFSEGLYALGGPIDERKEQAS